MSASQRLTRLDKKTRRYLRRVGAMRAQVAQIARTAYENGNLASPGALLTSGNPQQILDRASLLQELSSSGNAAMSRFLAAALQLSGAQQAARRTKEARAALKNELLGFNGNEHIGIYVGGGMLIDAPIPGQVVEKVALSGWYSANLDGAVRP